MEKNLGEVIVYLRKKRNMSVVKLIELSGLSKSQINRLEKNKSEFTLYTINSLSNALNVDLIEYINLLNKFDSFEEYLDYNEIRTAIEKSDYSTLQSHIIKSESKNNIAKHTMYYQVLLQAKALVKAVIEKNYKQSLAYCFEALGITDINIALMSFDKYIHNEVSFALITLIEYNYFKLNNYEMSKKILNKGINIIEQNYFDDELPRVNISKIIFRSYISLINNYADLLHNNGHYKESIAYCERGIQNLKEHNSTLFIEYIYKLLFENYYKLDDIINARKYYKKSIYTCNITDNDNYLQSINKKVIDHYPELIVELLNWEILLFIKAKKLEKFSFLAFINFTLI